MSDYKTYEVKVFSDGHKCWWLGGKLHREDGPAVEHANGDKYWYLNGKPHREDGPAIEFVSGDKCWYRNGFRHREDGPAVECESGNLWYLNNMMLSEKEFLAKTKPAACEGKTVEIDGKKYKLISV